MSISAISRDQGTNPSIVRITCSDDLNTITASGYLTNELDNIEQINAGPFEWVDSDIILVNYDNDKWGYFKRDADIEALAVVQIAGMIQQRVSVTAAQLDGAYAAPIELIPAPGANNLLVLHKVCVLEDYGGTVFANGGAIHIQYASTANGGGTKASDTLAAATLIGATADSTFQLTGLQALAASSTTVNKGLYLSNATAAFTGGTNTVFTVDVWYSIVSYA